MNTANTQFDVFWIVTDEHRCDGIGAYGNPLIKTPHLDRLAEEGVLFRNAFCQSPACVASRASFLSGRYPHTINNMWFEPTDDEIGFFPEYLQSAGYHTVSLGKEHHFRKETPFNESIQVPIAEGGPLWLNPPYHELETDLDILRRYTTKKKLIIGGRNPLPPAEAETGAKVSRSIDYLKGYSKDNPLFFRMSILYPHTPVLPPKPFDTMYKPEDMVFESDDLDSKGRNRLELSVYKEIGGVEGMLQRHILKMRADYYGLCSYVDDEIGRFIDYLGNHWDRPYLLIFHPDHGNMLGEHDLHEKFNMYDPSIRVPLILKGQDIPKGVEIEQLVELIDLAPTILTYAGTRITDQMKLQGRDLLPLMKDPSIPWRKEAFIEHRLFGATDIHDHPSICKHIRTEIEGVKGYDILKLDSIIKEKNLNWFELEGTPYKWWGVEVKCIRTERYVLSVRPIWRQEQGDDYMGSLYDLKNDPLECENLFDRADYSSICTGLIEQLKKWDLETS